MTVYATASDMEDLLGERTYLEAADRDGDGIADSDAVAAALTKASSMADSYLARWLPIDSADDAPEVLKDAVIRIAHYQLTGQTGNEETRLRYEDAIRWLRDVAAGKASLGIAPADTAWVGSPDFTTVDRAFSRSSLKGVL